MPRTRIHALVVAQSLGLLACLIGACTEPSPCDAGEVLRDGWCFAVDAAAPAIDAAVSDDAGAGGEASAPSAFGKVCTTTAECVAPTVYCAVQPGKSVGFCTAFGCDLDPGVCPSGWGCMDITPFGLAQHICIPGS
jgi:hypothetical protein